MQLNRYLLLVLAASSWSLNFIIGKLLAGAVPPTVINLLRWVIAFMVFFPLSWKELIVHKGLFISRWRLILFLALTGYCLNGLTVYWSVHYTSAINASLLASFNPVIFAVLAFLFYRERINTIQGTGIIISVAGVLWIVFRGEPARILQLTVNLGDLFMLLSVLSWATYSLVYQKKAGGFPSASLFTVLLMGGLIINTPIVLTDILINGTEWIYSVNSSHILGIIALNLFPSLLAFVCWNKALLRVTSSEASIFLNLIPVLTTTISILFLGEQLLWSSVIGGAFILAGVLLVTNSSAISYHIRKQTADNYSQ